MSNFGAMVERVAREINRTTIDLGDEIRFAIIDAIEFHNDEADFFNESEHQFTTTDGQGLYVKQTILMDSNGDLVFDKDAVVTSFVGDDGDLPYDMIEIIGGYVTFHVGGNENNSYRLYLDAFSEIDFRRFEVGDTTSYPSYASYSPEGLRFVPPIQGSTHTVTFRYKSELFRPSYSWNGTSFSFTADSYTSAWFSLFDAERLIRSKAVLTMYERYIDDASAESRARQIHQNEVDKYRTKDTKARMTGRIAPGGFY